MPALHTPGGLITTARQLSFIAVLGAMLAGVLIAQFGGASASREPASPAGAVSPAKAATVTARPTAAPAPAPPGASARNHGDTVAMIGNCPVRVGDVIEGYRVQSIDAGGVRLVPSTRRDARK